MNGFVCIQGSNWKCFSEGSARLIKFRAEGIVLFLGVVMSAPKLTIETPFIEASLGHAFCNALEQHPEVAFAHFSFDTGMTYILCRPSTTKAQMHDLWLRINDLKRQQPASHFRESSWWQTHIPQLPPDRANG
jgi:hypothetical protein